MSPINPLSKREQDVLGLLLEGKSNKLIAQALHITERTVEFHLKNIYTKQQVNSRMELVLNLRESTVAGADEGIENSGNNPWWLFGLLIPVGGIIILGFYWAAPPAKSFAEDSLPA